MSENNTWNKEIRIIAFIVGVTAVVALIWSLRGAIGPLAIAALIAYVVSPIVEFISSRTRLKRGAAVVIVFVIMLLILASIPAVLTPVIINQIQEMEIDLESLVVNYDQYISTPIHFLQWTFYPSQYLPEIPEAPTNILSPLAEFTFKAVEVVTTNSIWVLFVLMTIFYLMMDGYRLTGWIIRIFPEDFRPDAEHLFAQLRHVWDDYMRSQLAFMLVVGLVDSLVWLAIGLPGAILLGFFTGLTSFVHEIGAIVSGVLSIGVALLIGSHFLPISNFWFAVVVFIIYMILTAIKNFWIRPVIVGRHVHIHSGVVFVIIIAALLFHGALAAFVAVPVFVSILVLGRYLRRRILGKPPFDEGVDPSNYFSIQPQTVSETPSEE